MHKLILQFGEKQTTGCVVKEKEKIATDILDSQGISNGTITDLNKFTKKIHELVKKLELSTNVKLQDTVVILPSEQIKIIYLSTQIKIKSKFNIDHMKKMIFQLKKTCNQNNLYLIKCFPCSIKMDEQKIENPMGMEGSICQITWSIFCTQRAIINNFRNAFNNLYINVVDYSVYDYELFNEILHDDDRKLGSTILNIKEENAIIYSIKNHIPIEIININMGYSIIDNEIAVKFNISIKQASHLRKKYCRGIANENDKNHHIKLSKRNLSENTISHYEFIHKTIPLIKKFISQLKNTVENKLDYSNRLFLFGEFAEIHGIEFMFNKYFEKNLYLLNKSNINNFDSNITIIDAYLKKTKNKIKKKSVLLKISHYILLGLKKIYDMINK
ncbi:hypothetical protein FZC35_01475 [Candidatus Cytomitobacter indipagum]|uniref:SHS2 domain-containing protein n=1 Tax=Candidatus Cytomitobacter indipagum TaxID=2601575 RepID=A0A5C0UFK6_9PROT|nr:hypothetical protein [Candidatus Cytomitobacter indipagum]QEK38042.1 hypothetical protein FZC35_01475 [Candidatus Cytomitobacter indipagum]